MPKYKFDKNITINIFVIRQCNMLKGYRTENTLDFKTDSFLHTCFLGWRQWVLTLTYDV